MKHLAEHILYVYGLLLLIRYFKLIRQVVCESRGLIICEQAKLTIILGLDFVRFFFFFVFRSLTF